LNEKKHRISVISSWTNTLDLQDTSKTQGAKGGSMHSIFIQEVSVALSNPNLTALSSSFSATLT